MMRFNLNILKLCCIAALLAIVGCGDADSPPTVTEPATAPPPIDSRPNIMLIIADDLAYSDLGAYGGEIATPNLDRLAAEGLKFTNFHTASTCSPTRSMVLSGVDNHQAGLGAMAEYMVRVGFDNSDYPGYEGHLNGRTATVAELLRGAGYNTYLSGKWHLGMTEETSPHAKGFDRTFALLNGGAGHIGVSPMLPWEQAPTFTRNGEVTEAPQDFYSSRTLTEEILAMIEADKDNGKPFFAYLAYTAPHWPLQAPQEVIDKYRGQYDGGYDQLQVQRVNALKALGIIPPTALPAEPLLGTLPWDQLDDDQRAVEARTMEIYAAMVDELDRYIGELLQGLEQLGKLDNTLVFFMSDNGAEGASIYSYEFLTNWVLNTFDNSFENLGNEGSYVMLGPNWARATNAHSRLVKSFSTEGGILAPAIMWHSRNDLGGQTVHEFASVLDLMPTFLELAQTGHPGSSYQGQPNLPAQGDSFASLLSDASARFRPETVEMGWELFGHQAFRKGDWKIVKIAPPEGPGRWQLYNLATDPSEQTDLADEQPDKLNELLQGWNGYVATNGVIEDWDAELEKQRF